MSLILCWKKPREETAFSLASHSSGEVATLCPTSPLGQRGRNENRHEVPLLFFSQSRMCQWKHGKVWVLPFPANTEVA